MLVLGRLRALADHASNGMDNDTDGFTWQRDFLDGLLVLPELARAGGVVRSRTQVDSKTTRRASDMRAFQPSDGPDGAHRSTLELWLAPPISRRRLFVERDFGVVH